MKDLIVKISARVLTKIAAWLPLKNEVFVVGWLLFVWFPWIWVLNAYIALTSLPALPELIETSDTALS